MRKFFVEFDSKGERIGSYVADGLPHTAEDIKRINPKAVEVSEEHFAKYVQGYIKGTDGNLIPKPPYVPTLEEAKINKLIYLDNEAEKAYIAGFYSNASGQKLYYDSDKESQTQISAIYNRTKETDWETKVRYPGVAPSGQAPIRARLSPTSMNDTKTVQLLNSVQLKILNDDMEAHLFNVKSTHWKLQGDVTKATTKEELDLIKWPE